LSTTSEQIPPGPRSSGSAATESIRSAWQNGFIASPAYDLYFFILSPLLALTIVLTLDLTPSSWATQKTTLFGMKAPLITLFIGSWTFAHLFAVIFRSHANPMVFKRHWPRFVIVPGALFLLFMNDLRALSIGLVIASFWDVYHTSMQNFGFCRIYDSKMGNSTEQGRTLDIWLNHLVYIGPIFMGLSLQPHLDFLLGLQSEGIGWDATPFLITPVLSAQTAITQAILCIGAVFLAYYIYAYWRLCQNGYRISPQKILLILSTACGSIWAWAFLPVFHAFFVANFFHGLQYIAIVWWTERNTMTQTLRLPLQPWGRSTALVVYLVVIGSAGIWYRVSAFGVDATTLAISIATVISLMHFWYDGFIWSVRKAEV